ncbi:MAG: hypothetical protein OWU84_02410 [Firmicutes bacterium]|nr:hypothetical protein [Bacillota bacterium]
MNLTLSIKLHPNSDQSQALLLTMKWFNAACNAIAAVAFRERTANKIRLQKLVYADICATFGLSAQMTVRAISKVLPYGDLGLPPGVKAYVSYSQGRDAREP